MNEANLKRLSAVALERLEATRNDDEQYGFLFRTPGARSYLAFLHAELVEIDINLVDIEFLGLSWSSDRWRELESGAKPRPEELSEWRSAVTRYWREAANQPDCAWRHMIWLTPIIEDGTTTAFAVFSSCVNDDIASPHLLGLYDDENQAEQALSRLCVIWR